MFFVRYRFTPDIFLWYVYFVWPYLLAYLHSNLYHSWFQGRLITAINSDRKINIWTFQLLFSPNIALITTMCLPETYRSALPAFKCLANIIISFWKESRWNCTCVLRLSASSQDDNKPNDEVAPVPQMSHLKHDIQLSGSSSLTEYNIVISTNFVPPIANILKPTVNRPRMLVATSRVISITAKTAQFLLTLVLYATAKLLAPAFKSSFRSWYPYMVL